MFEYLSFEDLKPHLLILIPIIAMFFITCIKKSKNEDLAKKFNIFFEHFPRIIISYVLCGIAASFLYFFLIFINLSESFIEMLLVLLSVIVSYITMIHYD